MTSGLCLWGQRTRVQVVGASGVILSSLAMFVLLLLSEGDYQTQVLSKDIINIHT